MSESRGRPQKRKYCEINEVVTKYKSVIVKKDGKLQGKKHDVWNTLSQELRSRKIEVSSGSLYSYVSCNTDNIRNQISQEYESHAEKVDSGEDIPPEQNNTWMTSSMSSEENDDKKTRVVEISLSKKQFDDLCITKEYSNKRGDKNVCKTTEREYTILKSGEWQLLLTEKLWEKAHIKCGYQYTTHKIYLSTRRGSFSGKCSCGGTINGEFTGKLYIIPYTSAD